MTDRLVDLLERLGEALRAGDVTVLTTAEQVDLVAALERVKGSAAACQARTVAALADGERRAEEARGVPPREQGRAVAAQVALAMRTSPARGRRFVGLAHALAELPHTYDALAAGETSEYRAFLVARETAFLTLADRVAVDAELQARPGGIGALGDRETEAAARAIGQRLDPASAVSRHSDAVRQRRVGLRPAPDGMSRLSAVLPLREGVAVHVALTRAAEAARATGDPRSRSAVMADELVGRVTGASAAGGDAVEVCLVMTDATLLGSDDAAAHHEPAQVVSSVGSHGTIAADVARAVVREAAEVWVRRLYRDPGSGCLVAMESHRRRLPDGLRRLVVLRDQVCRTPWCDAPIRHADHVRPWSLGGATSSTNTQGLCEACNQAKGVDRLVQSVHRNGSVTTTTPTGHSYFSVVPPLLGRRVRARAPA